MAQPRHAAPRRPRRERPEVYRRRRTVAALGLVTVVTLVAWAGAKLAGGGGPPGPGGSTVTTAPRASTTTLAPPSGGNPVTIAAVGDTILGNTPNLPPNPDAYLSPVASALAAPIVFGNLEGVLTDNAASSKCAPGSTSCYAFRNPVGYAEVFKRAGFGVMNAANNHSHDFGSQGVADQAAALKRAGIVGVGLPGQVGLVAQGKTKVAFVAFAPYPNTANLLDLPAARSLIAKARSQAQLVVVYMHAGAEGSAATHVTGGAETYVGENRGDPKAFARMAIDEGADLVIGSGPHVLRGLEWYRGRLIAYSLGNFAGYENFATGGTLSLSGILRVTLNADGSFAAGRFVGVALSEGNQPFPDRSGAAAGLVNQLSTSDFGASAARIAADGSISGPGR